VVLPTKIVQMSGGGFHVAVPAQAHAVVSNAAPPEGPGGVPLTCCGARFLIVDVATAMIELVYILRAAALAACGGEEGLRRCNMPPIKFSELERLVFDVLWQEERIAIYETAWELEDEVKKLADLGVIKYERGEITIDPNEFLKKIAPFELVAKNMIAGNAYLKHVIQRIVERTREYAKNIKSPQPA